MQAHGMVSPPAEQKQLLLKSLESMPSTEHERYLGNTLYPLVQAVDPARAGRITGMLLEMDVQIVPLNVHKIVALIVSPDMLLDIIKEAQTMLDCAQSPGGDQSNSPDSDPSAESTYGLEARVPARVLNTEMSEAALLEAVRGLRVAEPGLGFKPLAKLRAQQPDLGAAKEVRVALNTLKVESEAAKTATAPPAANQGDEYHELMAEGSRYASEQDWRKAGKAYREAIALRPDRPEAYFNLGGALGNSGHYVEAAQRFLEAMERFPVGSEHWAWATADAFEMLRLDECAEVVKPEWWNDEGLKALSARVLRAAPNEESPIDMRAYVLSGFSDAWEMGPRSAAELKEAAAHFDRSAALCDAPVWKVELSSLADGCRSLVEAI